MYQTESLYFEYIILGLPKKSFSFLMRMCLKKKLIPTVYAPSLPFFSKFFGLATFCRTSTKCADGVLEEALKRHALAFTSKKCVLLYTDEFEGFVNRKKETLEKFYLIKKAEDN